MSSQRNFDYVDRNTIVVEDFDPIAEISAVDKDWKKYDKERNSKSLYQVLKDNKIEVVEGESTGGFAMISINPDGEINTFRKYSLTAVKAALRMGQFNNPTTTEHTKFHPGQADVEAAKLCKVRGGWVVYDWKGGEYVPNYVLNLPFDQIESKNMRKYKHNLGRLHDEINSILIAKHFGTHWYVVFNRKVEVTHYTELIKENLEKPYQSAIDTLNEYYDSFSKSDLRERHNEFNDAVTPTPEKLALVEELGKISKTVIVIEYDPRFNLPEEYEVNPKDDNGQLFKNIVMSAPAVTYKLKE